MSDRTSPTFLKQRFLRSASLSHSPNPKKAIALPQTSKSDSYGALRYRTPKLPKQRFLRSASLSHPSTTPTAIPTERFAIAPPKTQNSDRTSPNPQKAIAHLQT
ncbi:MAG: hypothetical protein ACKO99_16340, partial [Dolichospermum sp.]